MPRRRVQRSPWPRRFMLLVGVSVFVLAIIAFVALSKSNIGLAFSMFVGIVVLLVFEIIVFVIDNRQRE